MKARSRLHRCPTAHRGGFTLMELMVVITIIAALMALTASVVLKYMGVQQSSNTQTTLNKVQSVLNRQWSAAKDQAMKETIPSNVDAWIRANLAGNDVNAKGRVRVIYVKLKMRQAFPMSFDEVFNNNVPKGYPLPPLPTYMTYLSSLGIKGSLPSYPNNFESAACLLMALQRAQSGGGTDSADLGSGGSTTAFALPNEQSIRVFADAWGRPIFFARFPTGSTVLNPNGPQPGANDPGDPQGYLNSPSWTKLMPQGQQLFSALALQQLAPQSSPPLSYKLAPMVASGGPYTWVKVDSNTWVNKVMPPGFDPITFTPIQGNAALYSNP